jgi:hypothetical protein
MPVSASSVIKPACLRITGQSRASCLTAKGSNNTNAPPQRIKASVIGGTWPTMKRPRTVLPAQNNDVSESNR